MHVGDSVSSHVGTLVEIRDVLYISSLYLLRLPRDFSMHHHKIIIIDEGKFNVNPK